MRKTLPQHCVPQLGIINGISGISRCSPFHALVCCCFPGFVSLATTFLKMSADAKEVARGLVVASTLNEGDQDALVLFINEDIALAKLIIRLSKADSLDASF